MCVHSDQSCSRKTLGSWSWKVSPTLSLFSSSLNLYPAFMVSLLSEEQGKCQTLRSPVGFVPTRCSGGSLCAALVPVSDGKWGVGRTHQERPCAGCGFHALGEALSLFHPSGQRGALPCPWDHLFSLAHYSPVSTCSPSLGLCWAGAGTSPAVSSVIMNESHINRLKWMNNKSPIPATVDGSPHKEIWNHLLHSGEPSRSSHTGSSLSASKLGN